MCGGLCFWSDRFRFFGNNRNWAGRDSPPRSRDVAGWSMVGGVVGATRARCPALERILARRCVFAGAEGASVTERRDVQGPWGFLRRPTEQGNLRKLMQVGAGGACALRGDAASRPARRSPLLPGFRRQTRPPVPKPSVAAKPSPADSCRASPRSPAATECRAVASASGSWNAAPAYSRR
jgi:hypothetical protein